MAAVLARGETILRGAAREPEIVDLGEFLVSLGARIEGLGTSTLRIRGVEQLGGSQYRIIPDRVEAGTFLIAAAITGGDVCVHGGRAEHLECVLAVLEDAGVTVETARDAIRACARGAIQPFHLTALPYPGVPSDLQAQLMALATAADGRSTIGDGVFPQRFSHVAELRRLGAELHHRGSIAIVDGVPRLSGSTVTACDLRASAALVLAGLAGHGRTIIRHAHHLYRGYERLAEKLNALGAAIDYSPSIDTVSPPARVAMACQAA
jgi:UDP-N-acetylglucosamine 1-carboxyvinyltransferase